MEDTEIRSIDCIFFSTGFYPMNAISIFIMRGPEGSARDPSRSAPVILLNGRQRGEHPGLILKMGNAPCPFGLQRVACCPLQNIIFDISV